MVSRSTERKAGVALQYAQMALSILIQLIYTPVMLRILGSNEFGIYNLASSVIGYLSLLSLGFGSSYIRFYSSYKEDDNEKGIGQLNGLYLSVFIIMGAIAFLAGLVLSANAELFYNEGYTENDIFIAKNLMIFLSINLAISFPSSVFVAFISSQEKFIFQKVVNIGKTVMCPAVNIVLLYLGYGSIGMVVATTIISIIVDMVNVVYCFYMLNMKIVFGRADKKLFKDIAVFSSFIALNQVIDQLNWQTDKIILGKMINGSSVAIYTIGAQINTMFIQFSTAISSVFAPKVNSIVSKKEKSMDSQLTDLFIRVGRIQWFVMALVLSGFVFFGEYFVVIWAGEEYASAYVIALLLMGPEIVPLIQNIAIEVQRAKNKHQVRSIAFSIMAIINVCISIWFVSIWGEIGAALGTAISIICCPILFLNVYYHLHMGLNIKLFWKSIMKTLPALLVPVGLGLCIKHYYSFRGLIDFVIIIVLYSIVYCICVYFIALNEEEKEMLRRIKARVYGHKNR